VIQSIYVIEMLFWNLLPSKWRTTTIYEMLLNFS